jgi:hypothetical protein
MIENLLQTLASGLILGSLVQGTREALSARRGAWLPACATLFCVVPIAGLSVGRWIHSFTGLISIPLTSILAWYVFKPLLSSRVSLMLSSECSSPSIPKQTLRTYWSAVVVLSAFHLPMSVGWGALDPHSLGWSPQFVWIPLALAVAFLWLNQIELFGITVVAVVAWKMNLLGSTNGWNYLVDPVAIGMSIAGLTGELTKAIRSRSKQLTTSKQEPPQQQQASHASHNQAA